MTVVWQPPVILRLIVLREDARVTKHVRPLLGHREGKGEAATSDFVPRFEAVGTPWAAGVV